MSRPNSAIARLIVGALVCVDIVGSSSSIHKRSSLQLGEQAQVGVDRSDVYIQSMIEAGHGATESDQIEYIKNMLKKFKTFADDSRHGVEERHKTEETRLQTAVSSSADQGVQLALQQSVTSNTESLLETNRVYTNMVNFAAGMEKFLSQATARGGKGCEMTTCGPHASCTDTTLGAQCVCNEGYIGTGKGDCAAPPEFMPHHLLFEGSGRLQTKAREINVAIFGHNTIAIVFTDAARGFIGRTVVGNVREAGMASLGPPEPFTAPGTQAFSPVVSGTEDNRILVSWRDKDHKGLCWMRGAAMGTTSIRGAEQHLAWGEPVNFCRSQSHKMASLPLPGNRVVVMFADKVQTDPLKPAESFGNSMLLEVTKKGAIQTLGSFRFSDYAVMRIEVTKLSPTTFVVAGRSSQYVDEMDASVRTNQEAMALFGEMSGDDLVFDPNPVNLEPKGTNIWARGVSLVAPNTFAYAYQRGKEQEMMLAIVHVNETTHKMQVLHKPSVVRQGVSPYVSMVGVPYTSSDPHTLTYYNGPRNSMLNVCTWDPAKNKLSKCEDFMWVQGKVTSVSGVHLGGGKSFMVFAPESGIPYYGVFSLAKK